MFKPDYFQEYALKTWYSPDNSLYRATEHPTIKLAGEVGELLDCYGKHTWKPGYDWHNLGKDDLPIVVSELGDISYYLRILTWQHDMSFIDEFGKAKLLDDSILDYIKMMYCYAGNVLYCGATSDLLMVIVSYKNLLRKLGYSLDYILTTNYRKLNSDETKHGWAGAGVK
jgi:hypothetical protein